MLRHFADISSILQQVDQCLQINFTELTSVNWFCSHVSWGIVTFIIYHIRGKITECCLAEREGIFVNHEGTFDDEEGMIT